MYEPGKGYHAKIVLDSLAPSGCRLTTFELRYPRMVHAELLTHRLLCLAGDSELEFDLPGGQKRGTRRVHRMRIDSFVDKWIRGAARLGSKPKDRCDISWIVDDHGYDAVDVASRLGLASAGNINNMCRSGELQALKVDRRWILQGAEVRRWRTSAPDENRFDMRAKLAGMRIRQLNEDTGDIQRSRVTNAFESGMKDVYEVRAGQFSIVGSKDHLVYTSEGWRPIGSLSAGSMIVVRKFGKRDDDKKDPMRLKKIDGAWRSVWQRKKREEFIAEDPMCRRCRTRQISEIHHVVAVHEDPSRALDDSNVTALCEPCHVSMHSEQGWQGGTYLYGACAAVTDVTLRGLEQTYDLEIAGPYPNFLANGVVVHNSRNSSSSRAIPNEKLIAQVLDDPAMPVWWGQNQSGMQAREELSAEPWPFLPGATTRTDNPRSDRSFAIDTWLAGRDKAVAISRELAATGLHKQIANRVIEPWMFITVLVSATEYANFFALRDHPDAQPEIAWVARLMREAYRQNDPLFIDNGGWHLPFVRKEDRVADANGPRDMRKISVGRCARVSYLTHDGRRDPDEDIALHDRLAGSSPGHWSPFEHVAMALSKPEPSGNFRGWKQYRKTFLGEHVGGIRP